MDSIYGGVPCFRLSQEFMPIRPFAMQRARTVELNTVLPDWRPENREWTLATAGATG